MKSNISISHPWLGDHAGSERVLLEFLKIFPKADLYYLWANEKKWGKTLEDRNFFYSYLNGFPNIQQYYKKIIPLLGPSAIRSLPTVRSNVHISNCHGFIKGINVSEETYHYCYCYSSIRWISDQEEIYRNSLSRFEKVFFDFLKPRIRAWEEKASENVDEFLSISNFVSARIKQTLKRDSKVIYPPVNTNFFTPKKNMEKTDYLLVSRFVPYKRINTAIEAFVRSGKKITIVGSGTIDYPDLGKHQNINFLSGLSDKELRNMYRSSKALVFTSVEDFGLVPVEALSCGTPVVALGEGGVIETVQDGINGIFYNKDCPDSLNSAIQKLEDSKISSDDCRQRALDFSTNKFIKNIKSTIGKRAK